MSTNTNNQKNKEQLDLFAKDNAPTFIDIERDVYLKARKLYKIKSLPYYQRNVCTMLMYLAECGGTAHFKHVEHVNVMYSYFILKELDEKFWLASEFNNRIVYK